jgi:autoinducer 2-degrading protein
MIMTTNRRSLLALGSLAFVAATSNSAFANPQDEKPLADRVKDALGDQGGPFYLGIHLKVKEGKGPALEKAFKNAVEMTRKEKGNKAYHLMLDLEDKSTYILYEHWDSLAALEEHLKADYIREALSGLGEILDGAPRIRILRLAVGK